MNERTRLQVGALCWRIRKGRPQVLLVTSRETRRWIIPKGWPMPKLVHSNAAKQEAFEEAGVVGRVKRKPLGYYSYDKVLADGSLLPCKVLVFSLEVEAKSREWKEGQQRDRKWLEPERAVARVQEPGLRNLIKLFGKELEQTVKAGRPKVSTKRH
jgi:8-oxo-dGTP pyrophosphatase MutT (NUDIX family)